MVKLKIHATIEIKLDKKQIETLIAAIKEHEKHGK